VRRRRDAVAARTLGMPDEAAVVYGHVSVALNIAARRAVHTHNQVAVWDRFFAFSFFSCCFLACQGTAPVVSRITDTLSALTADVRARAAVHAAFAVGQHRPRV
jgi:hypothetical protein